MLHSPWSPLGAALLVPVLAGWLAAGAAPARGEDAEQSRPPPSSAETKEAEAPDTEAEDAEDTLVAHLAAPWTGDLPGIVERGFLRLGTTFNPVLFSYDGPDQRGIVVDLAQEMQAQLRKTLGKRAASLTIVLAALPRDKLIPALEEGRVDVLAANLTVTPERSARVAFVDPILRNVSEVVVTGPSAPPLSGLDDLAGITLRVRPSSSYREHLAALNEARRAAGRTPLPVEPIDENMEDADILDLVAAGVLPAAVVDSHMAGLYAQIIDGLKVRDDLVLHEGGEIAWAVRKDAPELRAALDRFAKSAAKGTLLGNMLYSRYFKDTDRVENALDPEPSGRFRRTIGLIRKYADRYGFDAILIAAQGYQESRLDQSKRSAAGAVGIMQVMPATARDPAVGIPDIHVDEKNVHAGVKYLRLLRSRYFDDPEMTDLDRALFSFAAYNAGPGNISKARRRAEKMGLDPNVWFGSVELAAARVVSREPVVYVRNILKYYTTYSIYAKRLEERRD